MNDKKGRLTTSNNGFFMQSNITFDWNLSEYLTTNELITYIYMTRMGNNNEATFPSYQSIANSCCFSRRTAIRSIARLEELNLIEKKRRFNESNLYIVYLINEVFEKVNDKVVKKSNIKKSVVEKNNVIEIEKPDSYNESSQQIEQNKVLTSKESISHEEFFEKAWKYILSVDKTKGTRLRQGKSSIKATQQKELQKVGHEVLEQCLELYLKQNIEKKYYMLGSTWFNGRYEDFIDQAKELIAEGQKIEKVEEKSDDDFWAHLND